MVNAYSKLCAGLSRLCLGVGIVLLLAIIVSVQYQVFGRYVLNNTPTWAEALAMLLVLYVTAFGAAVGVRDLSHVGFETLVQMLPKGMQKSVELLAHGLVAVFGVLMAYAGWMWSKAKWNEVKPMLGVPDAVDYFPLVIAGILMALFAVEHMLARWRGTTVKPAWY
jgi:TRAP-type transport system small permease protein